MPCTLVGWTICSVQKTVFAVSVLLLLTILRDWTELLSPPWSNSYHWSVSFHFSKMTFVDLVIFQGFLIFRLKRLVTATMVSNITVTLATILIDCFHEHSGVEYWTMNDPASPASTKKCAVTGEDPSCSNSTPLTVSLAHLYVWFPAYPFRSI